MAGLCCSSGCGAGYRYYVYINEFDCRYLTTLSCPRIHYQMERALPLVRARRRGYPELMVRLWANKVAMFGLAIVALFFITAILAPFIAPHSS